MANSLREACDIYFAQDANHTATDERNKPRLDQALDRRQLDEITEEEWQELTRPWYLAVDLARARWKAAAVGVLRAAGYSDWKMYARYDIDGAGDLWRSNVISGERVTRDENHHHYKYTVVGGWMRDVRALCKRYE